MVHTFSLKNMESNDCNSIFFKHTVFLFFVCKTYQTKKRIFFSQIWYFVRIHMTYWWKKKNFLVDCPISNLRNDSSSLRPVFENLTKKKREKSQIFNGGQNRQYRPWNPKIFVGDFCPSIHYLGTFFSFFEICISLQYWVPQIPESPNFSINKIL